MDDADIASGKFARKTATMNATLSLPDIKGHELKKSGIGLPILTFTLHKANEHRFWNPVNQDPQPNRKRHVASV